MFGKGCTVIGCDPVKLIWQRIDLISGIETARELRVRDANGKPREICGFCRKFEQPDEAGAVIKRIIEKNPGIRIGPKRRYSGLSCRRAGGGGERRRRVGGLRGGG